MNATIALLPAARITPWGPWSPTCAGHGERTAQLRSLAALVAAMLGSGNPLVGILRRAESDPMAFVEAQQAIERLPALHRRRIMATFQAITWLPSRGRRES